MQQVFMYIIWHLNYIMICMPVDPIPMFYSRLRLVCSKFTFSMLLLYITQNTVKAETAGRMKSVNLQPFYVCQIKSGKFQNPEAQLCWQEFKLMTK